LYATVSITVIDDTTPNNPPVANNDTATTTAGTAIDIDVLWNDTDADGDPLMISAVTAPSSGQATVNLDETIHYVPTPGFTGTDTFQYTVSDGQGGEATATVTVTVNSAPGVSTVHVADIAMSRSVAGKNWKATATVTIVKQDNAPAISATVYGDWLFDGALLQANATAITDASGVAVFSSAPVKTNSGTFTFRVTNAQLTGATYEPALNAETVDSIQIP
jgi:hypothetical protein